MDHYVGELRSKPDFWCPESQLAAARKLVRFGTCLDAFYSSGFGSL
jgi:hypothetical protein